VSHVPPGDGTSPALGPHDGADDGAENGADDGAYVGADVGTEPWVGDPAVPPAHAGRPLHSWGHRARGCLAVLIALAVVLGGVAFLLVRASGVLSGLGTPAPDYSGEGTGSVVVQVQSGDSLADVGRRLESKGIVASVDAFITASDGETVEPGFYQLRKKMSASSALDYLIDGDHRVETTVTIPEGLTVDETLAAVAGQTKLTPQALRAAVNRRPDELGLPSYADGEVEGFLFPATYVLPPRTDATELLTMMVDRFDQAAADAGLEQAASELDLQPRDLVTVASLVQAEARRAQDFGKVARVIYNRDDGGVPLQFDSTVHFANDTVGQVYTTEQQREVDSPYNTYLVAGLPPGPIDSPGDQALAAAADPTPGEWMYFVTVDLATGETKFAETLKEHNRNVAELAEYCRSSDAC
jgi:UPF0755 protein